MKPELIYVKRYSCRQNAFSADLRPAGQVLGGRHHGQVPVRALGRKNHALAHETGQLGRLQVRNHHDPLADQLLRLIPLVNAGDNLPGLGADLHLEKEELLGLGNRLAGKDFPDPELQLVKVVDGDLRLLFVLNYFFSFLYTLKLLIKYK